VSLFDRGFKGGQIDLAHGAFIDLRISVVPVELGVVAHVVLDRRDYALALNSAHVGDGSTRSQERVFTEVFEVAAVHGSTMDIDSRAKQEMNAARAGILTKDLGHTLH